VLTAFVLNSCLCLEAEPIWAYVAQFINVPVNALTVVMRERDAVGASKDDHLMASSLWAIFLASTLYQFSLYGVSNLLQVGQGLVEMSIETVHALSWLSTSIVMALICALVMTRSISHVSSVRLIYVWMALVVIGANTAFMRFGSSSRFPEVFFYPGAVCAVPGFAAWYLIHVIVLSPAFCPLGPQRRKAAMAELDVDSAASARLGPA